ncbi:MAG TPA: hypothetical protein VN883_15570 [Myxococcales bacterium]|nr:hypothetical protein [Myxococcales bacterium]
MIVDLRDPASTRITTSRERSTFPSTILDDVEETGEGGGTPAAAPQCCRLKNWMARSCFLAAAKLNIVRRRC